MLAWNDGRQDSNFAQIMFEKPLVARKHEYDLINHVNAC